MSQNKKLLWIVPVLVIAVLLLWRIISTSGEIPAGTSVGTWSVGGKSFADASRMIAQTEAEPLTVSVGKERLRVSARALRPNISETLGQIPDASLWQRLSGAGGNHYPVRWKWNNRALRKTYKKALALQEDPVDAFWQWTGSSWKARAGERGTKIPKQRFWQGMKRAASLGGGPVDIMVVRTKPKTTQAELRQKLPTQLLVDQSDYKIYVYRKGRLERTYPVAVGAPGFETPNGDWTVIQRAVDPPWMPPEWAGAQAGILVPGGTPENPLVARWMGIGDGVGIHGTRDVYSLGSQASHGCIRMDPDDVIELYEVVPLGTPLRIQA